MDYQALKARGEELGEELTRIRRELHARPELGWKEVETSRLIEERLRAMGYERIRRGFKGTESGLVADLVGGRPGPRVALRADIDALPIQEETGLPYASQVPGVMHACGHDAHAAMLLGAARILRELREELPGEVRLVFQPAEESGYDSGAPAMIAEGALEGVAAIGGLHVWAPLATGKFGYRRGPYMASADLWEMRIRGRGGHGSMPHKAVDPTVAAAHIVSLLQTVVSREVDPLESAVVSVGKIEAGNAPNVIPETALLTGNVRSTSRATRDEVEASVRRIAAGASMALRCETEVRYTRIYPVTVNDPGLTDVMLRAAGGVLGPGSLVELPIIMGSEDFSNYGEKVPATFAMLGMADPAKGSDRQHHSPGFAVDDSVLGHGAAILAAFALEFLEGAAG
ncbi:MAG TPA: M20 family metallopeptidase [Spirochaetales bacterium]|nr:M20 family metallopeptidase [Spirochaetales bacterium]HRY53200.1 M20 family metallopeptidase [Spirochaetia bacterium]HRZ64153.1 M20 family metallopeptidase [Spirochaetia bacterium]